MPYLSFVVEYCKGSISTYKVRQYIEENSENIRPTLSTVYNNLYESKKRKYKLE